MHNARLMSSCKGPEIAMTNDISTLPPLAWRRIGAGPEAA